MYSIRCISITSASFQQGNDENYGIIYAPLLQQWFPSQRQVGRLYYVMAGIQPVPVWNVGAGLLHYLKKPHSCALKDQKTDFYSQHGAIGDDTGEHSGVGLFLLHCCFFVCMSVCVCVLFAFSVRNQ